MLVLANGELTQRIAEDPRWSDSQRDAVRKAAAADPQARVLGLDQKMRPVVACKLRGADRRTQYAVLRNGAPAKPVMPLQESWRNAR